jgi:fructosamine-3-kinase
MTVFNFCIKVTPMARLSEANAMRFVAQHTSVPVPKVYCAFVHKGSTYLVMSKVKERWHAMDGKAAPSSQKQNYSAGFVGC